MTALPACRFCGAGLIAEACDFGLQPLANNLVPMDAPKTADPAWRLRVMVCTECLLVQLDETVDPAAMFATYAYRSSVSASWRAHTGRFAAMARARFGLGEGALVMEVGSNDGCLLHSFVGCGARILGVDPAANLAAEAASRGVPTVTAFFGQTVAKELVQHHGPAKLLIANNVLAHAPDLADFTIGLATALAPDGMLSIEVPHVLAMLQGGQFDTVYHEHVFYFSALALQPILRAVGLTIFDVEALPTHGGSLRLFAQHSATGRHASTDAVQTIIATERAAGLDRPDRYRSLAEATAAVVGGVRAFLDQARKDGMRVAAYGAAAKGTMLLNAVGADAGDIACVADANPLKQSHRLPGCRIPIVPPETLRALRPDFLLVLPWNIAPEIMADTHFIGDWGGRFVIPSPALTILPA